MEIYNAIIGVMGDINTIAKGKKNQQQGFMYRGVDDVMNVLKPLFVKHKIFAVPNIIRREREERLSQKGGLLIYSICDIEYTFYASDGSFVKAVVTGEGMDSGDKATNKSMAIAFKYACFQVFCIPTEEIKDPDADDLKPAPKTDEEAERQKILNRKINSIEIEAFQESLKETDSKMDLLFKAIRYNGKLEDMTFGIWKHAMDKLEEKAKKVKVDLGL